MNTNAFTANYHSGRNTTLQHDFHWNSCFYDIHISAIGLFKIRKHPIYFLILLFSQVKCMH